MGERLAGRCPLRAKPLPLPRLRHRPAEKRFSSSGSRTCLTVRPCQLLSEKHRFLIPPPLIFNIKRLACLRSEPGCLFSSSALWALGLSNGGDLLPFRGIAGVFCCIKKRKRGEKADLRKRFQSPDAQLPSVWSKQSFLISV